MPKKYDYVSKNITRKTMKNQRRNKTDKGSPCGGIRQNTACGPPTKISVDQYLKEKREK